MPESYNFRYIDNQIPPTYQCSECGVFGCKLWRQYQTFLNHINLLCVDCALLDQKVDYDVNEDGYHYDDTTGRQSASIKWLVPAIPTEDNRTFWGYISVPEAGAQWWKQLPLRTN